MYSMYNQNVQRNNTLDLSTALNTKWMQMTLLSLIRIYEIQHATISSHDMPMPLPLSDTMYIMHVYVTY